VNDFDLLPQPALGERLRRLRLQRGLKQADLADNGGLSTSYVSRIESGTRSVNLHMAQTLAARLGVDVSIFQVSREAYLSRLLSEGQRALAAHNHPAARELFTDAYARAARASLAVQWSVRTGLVLALRGLGAHDDWLRYQRELVALAHEAASPALLTEAYVGLSESLRQSGRTGEAYAAARTAADHAEDPEVPDRQRMLARLALVGTESETGRAFDADRHAQELLAELSGDLPAGLRAQALWVVASVETERGRGDEATRLIRDAVAALPTGEDPVLWARLRMAVVSLTLRAGRGVDDETREWFDAAAGVVRVLAVPVYRAQLDVLAARIAFAERRYEDARTRCEEALERAPLLSFQARTRARMLHARTGAHLGERVPAIKSIRSIAEELDEVGARDLAAEAWRLLAELALDGTEGACAAPA
jgi:transcriptional regulator with XRE-family HTH domain